MNLNDKINIEDFFFLLSRRLWRYGEVLLGKGSYGRIGQVASNEHLKKELKKIINDFQLLEGDLCGYGLNYIKYADNEYKNFDIEEIIHINELNKHRKFPNLNLILFSIIDFDFQFNIIQINTVNGKFHVQGLEIIPIDKNIKPKFQILSPKIFITIESIQTLKFQLDPNLSVILKSPNQYAKRVIDNIKTKKVQSEKLEQIPLSDTDEIINALSNQDTNRFITILKSIFSTIPYQIFGKDEKFYHAIMHVIIRMVNRRTNSEISNSTGRTDTVIELQKFIYILEFKVMNADKAIQQIHDRKYYEPYLLHRKEIILLGLAFNDKTKGIEEYKEEKLQISI